jgi:hypothetical protein
VTLARQRMVLWVDNVMRLRIKKGYPMNHKTLAILLAALLGGMALYYNQSTSDNAAKVETTK